MHADSEQTRPVDLQSCLRNSHTLQYACGPCTRSGTPTVPTLAIARNCDPPRPSDHTLCHGVSGSQSINHFGGSSVPALVSSRCVTPLLPYLTRPGLALATALICNTKPRSTTAYMTQ